MGEFLESAINVYKDHYLFASPFLCLPLCIILLVAGTIYEANFPDKDSMFNDYQNRYEDVRAMCCLLSFIPIVAYPMVIVLLLGILRIMETNKHYEIIIYFLPVAMLGLLWML